MGRALSLDLRERVWKFIEDGGSRRPAARISGSDVQNTIDEKQWYTILNDIAAEHKNLADSLKKGRPKSERMQFLSEAVAEFRYFKDGWRNYVSHAKVPYDEKQAEIILAHVSSFIEVLSLHLKEP